jgi:hypothetical protein
MVFPLIGGSLVEGLMTAGSDLDLCVMIDDGDPEDVISKLRSGFKRSMSELDAQLKRLGLSGVCRISRRIHRADEFLGLHMCHESRAAVLRTGVRLNFILSTQLLHLKVDRGAIGERLASERDSLRLKRGLYGRYAKALGYAYIPILPYVLERPGGFTPGRVLAQVQLAVNDLLLATSGIEGISGTLYEKAHRVMGIPEGKAHCDPKGSASTYPGDFDAAFDLIVRLKQRASADRRIHQKSFNYLASNGYVEREQLECIKQLGRYFLERISMLEGKVLGT